MNKSKDIHIRKASGETELFDISKLKHSLTRAGADKSTISIIAEKIMNWLSEGATTKQIYSYAYKLMREINQSNALRYKLKQSLLELGETGYPFEHLVGEIFKRLGFDTEVGKIIDGRCIHHEVDVIATNSNEQKIIECKYSQNQGKHVGIQVPLYVASRVEDIVFRRKTMSEYKHLHFTAYVITNTRFSEDSIEYAKCAGIKLMSWDYPEGKALKDLIEKTHLFPITILHHLTKKETLYFLEKGIVSCFQLKQNLQLLDELKITGKRKTKLLQEIDSMNM